MNMHHDISEEKITITLFLKSDSKQVIKQNDRRLFPAKNFQKQKGMSMKADTVRFFFFFLGKGKNNTKVGLVFHH